MKLKTGKITGKHAVAVSVLLVVLYCVFPASPSAGSTPTGNSGSNESPTESTSGIVSAPEALAGSHQVSPPSNETAPELSLIVEPLPEMSDEDLQKLISESPFLREAPVAAVPETAAENVAAQEGREPAAANPSRIEQLTAGTKINLLYSSSRGTSVAIINDEIMHSGGTTKDGLNVDAIRSDGLDLSLSTK